MKKKKQNISSSSSSSSNLFREKLQFEKKNQSILRLPQNVRIHKRPIPQRPPIASPHAGSSVPKTVYIATTTPFMSAAKRVQKLLRQAERRAITSTSVANNTNGSRNKRQAASSSISSNRRPKINNNDNDKDRVSLLVVNSQPELQREKVLIKATGKAIDKALDLGRWFEEKKDEYAVHVKTGSVCVVDDILEEEEEENVDGNSDESPRDRGRGHKDENNDMSVEDSPLKLNIQGSNDTTMAANTELHERRLDDSVANASSSSIHGVKSESKNQRRRRLRRERRALALGSIEMPESRTRWVNTVEISVNLR